MALTATSAAQLNALLALLTAKNPAVCEALLQNASSLSTTHKASLLEIITKDGFGSADPKTDQITAVATLITDIAAND